jgi:hypothetical protein
LVHRAEEWNSLHLRHCAGWPEGRKSASPWFKECFADYGEELG